MTIEPQGNVARRPTIKAVNDDLGRLPHLSDLPSPDYPLHTFVYALSHWFMLQLMGTTPTLLLRDAQETGRQILAPIRGDTPAAAHLRSLAAKEDAPFLLTQWVEGKLDFDAMAILGPGGRRQPIVYEEISEAYAFLKAAEEKPAPAQPAGTGLHT